MDKKEYHKQYYLNNKEKIKEHGKKYYLNNKEKCKTVRKRYRDENKDKLREKIKEWNLKNERYMKEYYLDNKENIKEYYRQYYLGNKEKIEEKKKVWRQSHQIWFLGKSITVDNIERTLSCMCCRYQGSTDLHHLKYDLNDPLKYTIELCSSCHSLWHVEEYYLRFGIRRFLPSKELMVENQGGIK